MRSWWHNLKSSSSSSATSSSAWGRVLALILGLIVVVGVVGVVCAIVWGCGGWQKPSRTNANANANAKPMRAQNPSLGVRAGAGSATDCAYGPWSAWIGCDANTPAECGDGVAVRVRAIASEASNGGAQCAEIDMVETQDCLALNSATCANAACSYTEWGAWAPCPSVTCEPGSGAPGSCGVPPMTWRVRSIARPALPGAAPCETTNLIEMAQCQDGAPCPRPQPCVPQDWADAGAWSGCATDACALPGQPTGELWEYQLRGVQTPARNGGAECALGDFVRSRTCALPPCTGCVVEGWGAWSQCDVPCSTPGRAGMRWAEADAVQSGTYDFCITTSVSACPGIEACPTGAFDAPTAVSCPHALPGFAFFPPSNSVTLDAALALCAETDGCAGVTWGDGSVAGLAASWTTAAGWGWGALLADVDACVPQSQSPASQPAWNTHAWDAASTACVPPTQPMLDAECLHLCTQGGSLSARGRSRARPKG